MIALVAGGPIRHPADEIRPVGDRSLDDDILGRGRRHPCRACEEKETDQPMPEPGAHRGKLHETTSVG